MSDTPRTDADLACEYIDKLASECKLNPTAYQREGKGLVRTLERENQQLRKERDGWKVNAETMLSMCAAKDAQLELLRDGLQVCKGALNGIKESNSYWWQEVGDEVYNDMIHALAHQAVHSLKEK